MSSNGAKRIFISDLHMNTDESLTPATGNRYGWIGPGRLQALANFLKQIPRMGGVEEVVILGDLYDNWVCPATKDPAHFQEKIIKAKHNREVFDALYSEPFEVESNAPRLVARTSDVADVAHGDTVIRELDSTVSRAALSSPDRIIRASDVEFLHATEPPPDESRERLSSLREAERAHIIRVLESAHWNKKQAAAILDISRGTLYRKIVEFALEPEAKPSRSRAHRTEGAF